MSIFQKAGLIEEPIVERNLRANEWVLASNHLESAEHVAALETVDLVGVISAEPDGTEWTVDTSNQEGYLPRTDPQTDSGSASNAQSSLRKGAPLDTYVFKASGCEE